MVRGYGERIMPDGTVTDSTGGAGWSSSKGPVAGAHQGFVRRADAKAMLNSVAEIAGWKAAISNIDPRGKLGAAETAGA